MMRNFLVFIIVLLFFGCVDQEQKEIDSYREELEFYVGKCFKSGQMIDTNVMLNMVKKHFNYKELYIGINETSFSQEWDYEKGHRWFFLPMYRKDSLEFVSCSEEIEEFVGNLRMDYEVNRIKRTNGLLIEYDLSFRHDKENNRFAKGKSSRSYEGFSTIVILVED